MPHPKILLTNDDGVNSVGLWAAYEALSAFADVTVAAPAVQQSAVGRSISIFAPLRMNAVQTHGTTAYVIEGRPTDSLLLGLYALHVQPDLVVSGINIGENITSESVTTSGTVGAAMEAANQGVPAMAFSLQVVNECDKFTGSRMLKLEFTEAKKAVAELVQMVLREGLPDGAQLINVNIPAGKVNGYRVTTLGSRLFNTSVERRLDPRGEPYYWICGDILCLTEKNTDAVAVQDGFVSVTPLTLDNTAYASCEKLDEMVKKL
ncbi:MAG: 5'/3'-nucleotidase SurE [Methanocorpusculum sp.]|nr:5'/3'-nucleotidase SurE [Methanocorpusculum sp.]